MLNPFMVLWFSEPVAGLARRREAESTTTPMNEYPRFILPLWPLRGVRPEEGEVAVSVRQGVRHGVEKYCSK